MRGFLFLLACLLAVVVAGLVSPSLTLAQGGENSVSAVRVLENVLRCDVLQYCDSAGVIHSVDWRQIRREYGDEAVQSPDPSIWWREDAAARDMRGFYYFIHRFELKNGQWYLKPEPEIAGKDDQAACGKRLGGRLLKLLTVPFRLVSLSCPGSC